MDKPLHREQRVSRHICGSYLLANYMTFEAGFLPIHVQLEIERFGQGRRTMVIWPAHRILKALRTSKVDRMLADIFGLATVRFDRSYRHLSHERMLRSLKRP